MQDPHIPSAPQPDEPAAPTRGLIVHIGMDHPPLKKRPGKPRTLQRRPKPPKP
ncbi:MAG: hypothetical protein IJ347_01490 [Faecalibacterium sp.]|nr:hypothetical protein [Faecalibacterium sp.]